MKDLPSLCISEIFKYLWFEDLAALALVSKKFKSDSVDNVHLLQEILIVLLHLTGTRQRIQFSSGSHSAKDILTFAYRLCPWPTDTDLNASLVHFTAPPGLKKMNIDSPTNHILAYQGVTLGRNRSIIADNHFPVLRLRDQPPRMSGSIKYSTLPFTKVVSAARNQPAAVMLSTIAYFEVAIHQPVPPVPAYDYSSGQRGTEVTVVNRNDTAVRPCVAVGLALPGFSLRKMPGWDKTSYGWHGDDGLFFHGSSIRGHPLHGAPDHPLFITPSSGTPNPTPTSTDVS